MAMSRRQRPKARAEQDYWYSFLNEPQRNYYGPITEEQRQAFYVWDSTGGVAPLNNPFVHGKLAHGQLMAVLRDWRNDRYGWIGGYYLVEEWLADPRHLRPLAEAFGAEVVAGWLDAWAGGEGFDG